MDVDEASPSIIKHRPSVLTNCCRLVGQSGFLDAGSFSALLAVSKAPSAGFDPCALTLAWRLAAERAVAANSLTSRTAIGANGRLALDHVTRIDIVDKVLSLAIVNPHRPGVDKDFEIAEFAGEENDEGEHATTSFMDAWEAKRVRGYIVGQTALYLYLKAQGHTPTSLPTAVEVDVIIDRVFGHVHGLVRYDGWRNCDIGYGDYEEGFDDELVDGHGRLSFRRQLRADESRLCDDMKILGEKVVSPPNIVVTQLKQRAWSAHNLLEVSPRELAARVDIDALQIVAFYDDDGALRFEKTLKFDEAVASLRVAVPVAFYDSADVAALRRWGFVDAPMELECADLGKLGKLLPANQMYASEEIWKYHDPATTSALLCAGRVVPRKQHGRIWRDCLALYARTPRWALRLERTRVGSRPKLELLALTKSIRKQIPKLLDYSLADIVSGIGGSYALHNFMSRGGASLGWEPNDVDYYHLRHGDAASRLGDSIAAFKAALVARDGPFRGGVTLEMDDVTRLAHRYPPIDDLRPTIVNDYALKITFLDGVTGGRHEVKMEKISFIEIETGNPNLTLDRILASYDIDVCSVGMRLIDGEWHFICAEDVAAAIEAKTMTVREGRITGRTDARVRKYESRGFALSDEERIMALLLDQFTGNL